MSEGALRSDSHMAPPSQPTGDLIRLIEHHDRTARRRELPERVCLARRVEIVHGARRMAPTGIAAPRGGVAREPTAHIHSEERSLFTRMRHHRYRMLAPPIAAIAAEHDDHVADPGELEPITPGFEALRVHP
jgi:regulator of cell morphogenesis and NO signaling